MAAWRKDLGWFCNFPDAGSLNKRVNTPSISIRRKILRAVAASNFVPVLRSPEAIQRRLAQDEGGGGYGAVIAFAPAKSVLVGSANAGAAITTHPRKDSGRRRLWFAITSVGFVITTLGTSFLLLAASLRPH